MPNIVPHDLVLHEDTVEVFSRTAQRVRVVLLSNLEISKWIRKIHRHHPCSHEEEEVEISLSHVADFL
jgi:hypothetical protein